jgi:surface antigen
LLLIKSFRVSNSTCKSAVNAFLKFSVMAAIALALSGCLSTGLTPQPIAPVVPTKTNAPTSAQLLESLKGGLIGGSLGANLTAVEKQRGLVAEYQALETSFGQAPVSWVDDKTGNAGEVVAGAPYRVGEQDCRPFTHRLTVKKVITSASGSACRQANGSWLLLQ